MPATDPGRTVKTAAMAVLCHSASARPLGDRPRPGRDGRPGNTALTSPDQPASASSNRSRCSAVSPPTRRFSSTPEIAISAATFAGP
jgi:hypothetical protein